jgi:hypothetical protein
MARPSPNERKKLDARRIEKAKLREDAAAREAKVHAKVQAIVDTALARSRDRKGMPDVAELIDRLEDARALAMACAQPKAAVDAVMAEAKLLGYVVDRAAVAVGKPEDFLGIGEREAEEREAFERIRERHGTIAADRFMKLVADMRVIEGEAKDVEDDDGDEA